MSEKLVQFLNFQLKFFEFIYLNLPVSRLKGDIGKAKYLLMNNKTYPLGGIAIIDKAEKESPVFKNIQRLRRKYEKFYSIGKGSCK